MPTEFLWHDANERLPDEGQQSLLVVEQSGTVFTATSYKNGWFRLVCAGYPFLSDKHVRFWAEIPPFPQQGKEAR